MGRGALYFFVRTRVTPPLSTPVTAVISITAIIIISISNHS